MAMHSETRDKIIEDFVNARQSKTTKSAAPIKKIELETLEIDGNTTWGKLTDTNGRYEDYSTTVYPDDFWPEEVARFIPKANPYFVYTDQFFRAAMAMDQGINVMLHGRAGTGKDETAKQYAALKNMPYRRITGMDGITPDVVLGSRGFDESGVTWIPGDAHLICEHGGIFVISEPAALPGGTMFAFQSALESNGYLSLMDHPDASMRMLPINEHTRFVLTSNVRGVGDNGHLYASAANVMDASFLNRIGSTIEFKYLPAKTEVELLKKHFKTIPDEFAYRVVDLGKLIRQGFETGEIEFEWSPRSMIPWVQMSLIYGCPAEGMRATFFDKLSDDEKGAVRGLWKAAGFTEDL